MKKWKKSLVEKMVSDGGNYFFFKTIANEMGIKHIKRQDVEGIISAYLSRRPNMKAYYDDTNNQSLFCGLWFAEKTMIFEDA
jgi:hypothetical protein